MKKAGKKPNKKRSKTPSRQPWVFALIIAILIVTASALFLVQQTPEIKYKLGSAYRWALLDGTGPNARVSTPAEVKCRDEGGKYYKVSYSESDTATGICHKTTFEENAAWFTLILGSVLAIALLVKLILLSIRRRSGAPMTHQ